MNTDLSAVFQQQFGVAPQTTICSPSRVNLIGEHTDYNDGFVLPMALEMSTHMVCSGREDAQIRVRSIDFDEFTELSLADLTPTQNCTDHWCEYVKGVVWAYAQAGVTLACGFDAVIAANVPIGAGLSSSSSFEMAIARALCHANDIAWDPVTAACCGKQDENDWVGVNCGIMDQLICAAAEAGKALMIDCQDLSTTAVPLPTNTAVVVMDTCTRRDLVTSAYNERRQSCEAAAQFLGHRTLRAVELNDLVQAQDQMDPIAYKRAFHVLMENQRVQAAALAMDKNDPRALGELMKASHTSLDQYFEVTNDALNDIVAIAQNAPGCFGARMTGAGFGGCAVALVDNASRDAFVAQVTAEYQHKTGRKAKLYVSKAMGGVVMWLLVQAQRSMA